MKAQRILKKMEQRVADLHKERTAHFNDSDETVYWMTNRKLNSARKELKNFIKWLYKNGINTKNEVPVDTERNYGYVRYETLSDFIRDRVFQFYSVCRNKNFYATAQGMARNLKDAVASLENA